MTVDVVHERKLLVRYRVEADTVEEAVKLASEIPFTDGEIVGESPYNSPSRAQASIVNPATGQEIDDFPDEFIFDEESKQWVVDPQGVKARYGPPLASAGDDGEGST